MSGDEPAASRVKRMLPSVSEVLKELTARAQVEPDVAFRAAREVCAEELKRIRDVGGDSVPLEELVQRAFQRATATYPQAPAAPPPRPAPPVYAVPEPPAPHGAPEGDDPFSETAGAMDLRWEGESREPFTEPQQPGTPRAGAPPEPYAGGPAPGEAPPTLKLQLDPAASSPVPLEPQAGEEARWPAAHPARVPEPEVSEGPGDETLGRLSREAESIDLHSVLRGAGAHGAVSFPAAEGDAGAREEAPLPDEPAAAPFEDDEDTVLTVPRGGRRAGRDEGGSRAGVVIGTLFGLAALAALGYLLVGLWLERDAAPVPVAVAKPRPARTAGPSGPKSAAPAAPAASPGPASAAAPASSVDPSVTAPATAVPAAAPPATAAPPLSIARPAPAPSAVAASPATPATGRVPAKPAPPVVATAAPAAPAAAAPTAAASAPVRQSRDGLVVTKDRAGLPQVYSIHFTSYKDRASAERDLKRIEKLVGREGFVAEVDLGEKGIWQRVMIGAFATAQEAKAAREELAAKRTPDMGWVYRVVAPEAAGPR